MAIMKQFVFILIFLLCLAIPSTAYSIPSKTIENVITITPSIPFEMAEDRDDWEGVVYRLKQIESNFENYIMLDALYISLKEEYLDATIALSRPLTTDDEPMVLFVKPDTICIEEIGFNEYGEAQLTLYKGNYFLCFYVWGE